MITTTLTPVLVAPGELQAQVDYWAGVFDCEVPAVRGLTGSKLKGAMVGPFLVLAGPPKAAEEASRVSVVLLVDDLPLHRDRFCGAGAVDLPLLDGPSETRCHLRHPGSLVTELIQMPSASTG